MRAARRILTLCALILATIGLAAPPLNAVGPTTGDITGVVTDESGAPVEGAVVFAFHFSFRVAETDADGRYNLVNLEPGAWSLNVSPPATRPDLTGTQVSTIVTATQVTVRDIVVPTRVVASIAGIVTDESGAAVPDVRVIVSGLERVSTALDGSYRVDGLTPGSIEVRFEPQGNTFETVSVVVLAAGNQVTTVDAVLPLRLPGSVAGIVFDDAGNPLAGATVSASSGEATSTDAAGAYTLSGLASGAANLTVSPPSSRTDLLPTVVVVSIVGNQTTNQNISLPPVGLNGAVDGVVTDGDGLPVPGATVSFVGSTQSSSTDASGRYLLAPVFAPFDSTIRVQPPFDRPDLTSVTVPVTLTPGQVTRQDVQLGGAAGIAVTVLGDGQPVPSTVSVFGVDGFQYGSTITGSGGSAQFGGLPSGEYVVRAVPNDPSTYASEFHPNALVPADAARIVVEPGAVAPVSMVLDRSGSISGTIVEPGNQPSPTSGVVVTPTGVDAAQFDFWRTSCQLGGGESGGYRIGCLHPAVDYTARALSPLGRSEYFDDTLFLEDATAIAVEPAQDTPGIDFVLEPPLPDLQLTGVSPRYFLAGTTTSSVRISGANFLDDPRGLTVTANFFGPSSFDVTIEVTEVISAGEALATVTVGAATVGSQPLPLGLSAERADARTADCTCSILIGGPNTEVGTIQGRVRAGGIPLPFATVLVRTSASGHTRVRADSLGRWSLDGLSTSETYTVIVEGTEAWAGTIWQGTRNEQDATPITLSPGQVVTINTNLQPRDPITLTVPNQPRRVVGGFDIELGGTGLSPISGGFDAVLESNGIETPLTTRYIRSGRIGLATRPFWTPPTGPGTVILRYTGTDGVAQEVRCPACVVVYQPLTVFQPFPQPTVARGSTSTVSVSGFGLVDITSIRFSGTGVRATAWTATAGFPSNLAVTVTTGRFAAPGTRTATIRRADGSTATFDVIVMAP